jgi:Cu-Zn family superoxide dismutase
MRNLPVALAGCLFALISGHGYAAEPEQVKIKIINAKQQDIGEATLSAAADGVLVRITLKQNPPGISPGTHAIHIHEVGKCEPPFKTAGGHHNPLNKKHGFLNKEGHHVGDLPNLELAENVPLSVEYFVPRLSLRGGKASLMDADGSALVIHQGADDYRTDPAGESGDRVACAVIEAGKAKKP